MGLGRKSLAGGRRQSNDGRFARQVMFVGLCASIAILSTSIVVLHHRTDIASRRAPPPLTHSGGWGRSRVSERSLRRAASLAGLDGEGRRRGLSSEEKSYAKRYARTRFRPEGGNRSVAGGGGGDDDAPPLFHRLPNALLVGAQKAGTTSIANFLFEAGACNAAVVGDEPEFYKKEVQFFNDEDRYTQGLPFYAAKYAHCPEGAVVLDATPNYLTYVRRIREAYEEAGGGQADRVKIIAILREPISRELSWYNHLVYQLRRPEPPEYAFMVAKNLDQPGGPGAHVITFGQYVQEQTLALLLGPQRKFDTATPPCHQDKYSEFPPCFGLYAHFLEEWFDFFDRERVLVLSYEELVTDPDSVKRRVADFLGLEKNVSSARLLTSANKHLTSYKVLKPGCAVTKKLEATFEKPNEDLYRLLEERPGPPMEQRPFPKFANQECEGAR